MQVVVLKFPMLCTKFLLEKKILKDFNHIWGQNGHVPWMGGSILYFVKGDLVYRAVKSC